MPLCEALRQSDTLSPIPPRTTHPQFPNVSKTVHTMSHNTLIFSLLSLAISLPACHDSHDHDSHHHDESAEAHEAHDPDEVHLSDDKARTIGLTTEIATPAPFESTLRVGGVIESSDNDAAAIVAPQSGLVTITSRSLANGVFVHAGQTIATISGSSLQDGDAAARAKMDYDAAARELERAKSLIGDKIISAKEFDDINLRYQTAKVAYEATASRMTSSGVAMKSPTSGHIVSLAVEQGAYVSAGQTIAIVEHCGRKRLRADVPERHFAALANVTTANFRVATSDSAFCLSSFDGKLLSFGRASRPGDPYIPVTFSFNDADELFFSGQYADIFLKMSCGDSAITVPNHAIIESQGLQFVYIKNPDEEASYLRREVHTGRTDGIRTQVLSGLHPGDTVVCQGARRLHLASATSAIPAHTHNH